MLTIDQHSAQQLKISLVEGSYQSLLSYPSAKMPQKNQWAEYHYPEYDQEPLKFQSKEVSLHFLTPNDNYPFWVDFFTQKNKRTFYFEALALETTLRFVGIQRIQYNESWLVVEVKFAEDEPFVPPEQGGSFNVYHQNITLNHQNIGQRFGINILQGTTESLLQYGNTHSVALPTNQRQNGTISTPQRVFFAENTATLKCFIYEEKQPFLVGYFGFLNELKKGISVLSYEGKPYNILYKSSKITEFYLDEKIWAKFDVEVAITN